MASITDVFGAAATGKTQFAFQNAVMTCGEVQENSKPLVVYIDCTGSFRPERIAEMALVRNLNKEKILEKIYTIYVRSVQEQESALQRISTEDFFSRCRLIIVDDATSNYVIGFDNKNIAQRQISLSLHLRKLALLSLKSGLSVFITNSARSRGEFEGETTGEIISQFALYRMHFVRKDRERYATLLQPDLNKRRISFEISKNGVG